MDEKELLAAVIRDKTKECIAGDDLAFTHFLDIYSQARLKTF